VMVLENNSFDYQLGALCVQENNRCDGATDGEISNGDIIPMRHSPDVVPSVDHSNAAQLAAYNHGAMNGWDRLRGCKAAKHYRCLAEVQRNQVPNLWTLADDYVISDRTFEDDMTPSFGSHLELVAGQLDGFVGDGPALPPGPGVGCDSHGDALWSPGTIGSSYTLVPTCVPDQEGNGPYRPSPVRYVPTIMDRLDAAGLTWRIYTPLTENQGYGHAICPTFYECLGSSQRRNMVGESRLFSDLKGGTLPNFSIVVPRKEDSEHNGFALAAGDDWIGRVVGAVMRSNAWPTTAIFITWDDCGCFYDHVTPPKGLGIRLPMVIVSPYAKPGFVDHTDADLASILAFTEHMYGLAPLPGGKDGGAYDYSGAFDFTNARLQTPRLRQHPVPIAAARYVRAHPPPADDPT